MGGGGPISGAGGQSGYQYSSQPQTTGKYGSTTQQYQQPQYQSPTPYQQAPAYQPPASYQAPAPYQAQSAQQYQPQQAQVMGYPSQPNYNSMFNYLAAMFNQPQYNQPAFNSPRYSYNPYQSGNNFQLRQTWAFNPATDPSRLVNDRMQAAKDAEAKRLADEAAAHARGYGGTGENVWGGGSGAGSATGADPGSAADAADAAAAAAAAADAGDPGGEGGPAGDSGDGGAAWARGGKVHSQNALLVARSILNKGRK